MPAPPPSARVVALYLAPRAGEPPEAVAQTHALASIGLEGDRYALGTGRWSRFPDQTGAHVTLIAAEDLEALGAATGIDLAAGQHRRNVVTRGVDLPGLIGRRFRLGGALLVGVRLCLPCRYLDEKAGPGARAALMEHGKGGLRAEVLEGGIIRVGDAIEVEETITT